MRQSLKSTEIDGETYYIVEGDLLLDEDQLRLYARQQELREEQRKAAKAAEEAGLGLMGIIAAPSGELLGITVRGKIVRWKPGLILSYCVLRQSFPQPGSYQMVRDNMLQATQHWEKTCGVQFAHKADLDGSPNLTPADVLFTVRGIDAGGEFIAAAFFPNDPINRRKVLIDPSYFDQNLLFDKVGVLRHELGHVLGFRHEHIRTFAPPACPNEDLWGTIDLTEYDPQSVMHYFCGGVGTKTLAITDIDKIGAQRVYGPPLESFNFIG
jgi:hypothetical protein